MRLPMNRHRIWQIAADGVLIAVAWLLAFQLRFDSFEKIPPFYEKLVNWQTVLLVVAIKLAVFTAFGFYNRWWRYVSTRAYGAPPAGVTVAVSPRASSSTSSRLRTPLGCHAGSRSSTGCSCWVSSRARACLRARSSSDPVQRASPRAARK